MLTPSRSFMCGKLKHRTATFPATSASLKLCSVSRQPDIFNLFYTHFRNTQFHGICSTSKSRTNIVFEVLFCPFSKWLNFTAGLFNTREISQILQNVMTTQRHNTISYNGTDSSDFASTSQFELCKKRNSFHCNSCLVRILRIIAVVEEDIQYT